MKVKADEVKTIKDEDTIAAGDWGAVFRVDAVEFGDLLLPAPRRAVGVGHLALRRHAGDDRTVPQDSRQIPFAAAGGRTPEGAHHRRGRRQRDPGLAHLRGRPHRRRRAQPGHGLLLRGEFADYSGNITEHPDVDYIQGDGRTFLARSDDDYDIIWFVAPDSYAARTRHGRRVRAVRELPLHQRDDRDAFDHLTADGVLVAQFGDLDFDARPTRTARYLVTAREALDDRIDDVRRPHRARRRPGRPRVRPGQHDDGLQVPGRRRPPSTVWTSRRSRADRPPCSFPAPYERRGHRRRDRPVRRRGRAPRRRLPFDISADRRRPAVLLALHHRSATSSTDGSDATTTPRSPSASDCSWC